MIVCVLVPRFALSVAAGGRAALAEGPAALAPEPGREQFVGEASPAAEACGVRAGLRLGEALARCPELRLVAPDPMGVADAWDAVVQRLEGIGAAVESERPGQAYFASRGLRRLHGGSTEAVLRAARQAVRGSARYGAAPARFAAYAAASHARARRAELAPSGAEALRRYLAPLPVSLLAEREEVAVLPPTLERFGVRTLGELAALERAAVADRFGEAGMLARELARGRDTPLRPRSAVERLEESLELPESGSGEQLERALGLLIDRLLARRERRGRTLRSVVLSAKLVEGGTWHERLTFREALSDPRRMRLALVPRLATLPPPADRGPRRAGAGRRPAGDQRSLLSEPAAVRMGRLREAVRQTRAVAGPDAALRVLEVDPDSRVPERRLVLAPWDA